MLPPVPNQTQPSTRGRKACRGGRNAPEQARRPPVPAYEFRNARSARAVVLRQAQGGRNRPGHHHRSPPERGRCRHRRQIRRRHPRQRVHRHRRAADRLDDRGARREARGPQRKPDPVVRQGRAEEELGQHPHQVSRGLRRHGPRQGQGQGRAHHLDRGRRLHAGLAHRRAAAQEPGPVRRPDLRLQGPQDQPRQEEHRPFPPRADRAAAHGEAPRPPRLHPARPVPQGHRQEHHRLRRLHRPRRHGRPAPHHRHELGPDLAPERDAQAGRGDRGDDHRGEPREGARLARPQADHEEPVGRDRPQVPGRRQGPRQGGQPRPLRRVRRDRAGRRGAGPHHRDVLDQAHQRSPPSCSRSARSSTRSSSASRRRSRRSRSGCASSSPIPGTWSATTTRSAPASAARCAT